MPNKRRTSASSESKFDPTLLLNTWRKVYPGTTIGIKFLTDFRRACWLAALNAILSEQPQYGSRLSIDENRALRELGGVRTGAAGREPLFFGRNAFSSHGVFSFT